LQDVATPNHGIDRDALSGDDDIKDVLDAVQTERDGSPGACNIILRHSLLRILSVFSRGKNFNGIVIKK
jgi:hypothetical protein